MLKLSEWITVFKFSSSQSSQNKPACMRLLLQQEHGQVGLARRRQWKHYSQKRCFCLLGPKPGYRAAKKALKTALALNSNQIKYLACRIIIYQRQECFRCMSPNCLEFRKNWFTFNCSARSYLVSRSCQSCLRTTKHGKFSGTKECSPLMRLIHYIILF